MAPLGGLGAALGGAQCDVFTYTRSTRTPRTQNATRWPPQSPSTMGRQALHSGLGTAAHNELQHAHHVPHAHRPASLSIAIAHAEHRTDPLVSQMRAHRTAAKQGSSRRAPAARARRGTRLRSWPRAQALSDGDGWCGVMGCVRRWAGARACEAVAIARHGAVDLAVVPSTICRQCTRVVGECAGSRLAVPIILDRVRFKTRDLDGY